MGAGITAPTHALAVIVLQADANSAYSAEHIWWTPLHMFRLAAIVLIWILGTTGAQAISPGFDCGKAATVMERLICTDGGLAAMDQSLTDAFKERRATLSPVDAKALFQQQRDWIKQRNLACPMPHLADDKDFTLQQMWQLAPCVAAQYRQRLATLGVSPPPILPMAQRPDFIHPLCMGQVVGEEAPQTGIPLMACNKGNAHVPLEEKNGFLSAEGGMWSAVLVNGGIGIWGRWETAGTSFGPSSTMAARGGSPQLLPSHSNRRPMAK